MNKLFLTLIGCLIFFEAKTNQIASQLKCNGKLEGVTIDSRGDNKSTIDSISDNGEFYCHLTLRNGNLVPFSCERYEIVEINGQSILFVSGIDLSNIPWEDVQNGDNFVAFSECYVHVDYRTSSYLRIILDEILKSTPQSVGLKLPKLKKVSNQSSQPTKFCPNSLQATSVVPLPVNGS